MSSAFDDKVRKAIGVYFPSLHRTSQDKDTHQAFAGLVQALKTRSLSWARLNQALHRNSEAGMSKGFFRYYFLEACDTHPYPVKRVLGVKPYSLPKNAEEIRDLRQLEWGVRRFFYDSMLYWGNIRQAYRDLRHLTLNQIRQFFAAKREDKIFMKKRGKVQEPSPIEHGDRYLSSEIVNQAYEDTESLSDVAKAEHVKWALQAFRNLESKGQEITPQSLREETKNLAEAVDKSDDLFILIYEEAPPNIKTERDIVALYEKQWKDFKKIRKIALENTRIYLSICNDLDVYIATSMRSREDFTSMASVCERIFKSNQLSDFNLRYFDPTLSVADHHEDKGIIECLMVKSAKVLLYFSQYKESLGKVSEYAMALSLGKPVIVLCPDDKKGRKRYHLYRSIHPLMRLVEFETGVVNGAMVTYKEDDVITLLKRIFTNRMEYNLSCKPRTKDYYLLKERITETTVRVLTDDKLLIETFWNYWSGKEYEQSQQQIL